MTRKGEFSPNDCNANSRIHPVLQMRHLRCSVFRERRICTPWIACSTSGAWRGVRPLGTGPARRRGSRVGPAGHGDGGPQGRPVGARDRRERLGRGGRGQGVGTGQLDALSGQALDPEGAGACRRWLARTRAALTGQGHAEGAQPADEKGIRATEPCNCAPCAMWLSAQGAVAMSNVTVAQFHQRA